MTHHQVRQTPQPAGRRSTSFPFPRLLQNKHKFVKSPTAAQSLLCFGRGKVGGGRSRHQEGPQQCHCTTRILHRRARPCSRAASLILQGPPPPTCKHTVHSDSTVQAVGWIPTKPFCLHGGRRVSPSAKTKKLHRQSLAASSHGRAFHLTTTSMKPAVAIYLNSILKSSRRFQRSKDKTTVSSAVQRLIHSYLHFILAGAKTGCQAIAFQRRPSLAEPNQVNTCYCFH